MPGRPARNGEVSFWWSDVGRPAARTPLAGPTEVDVAVVGAGYTGLWAAYYLARAAPQLRIAVLERRFAGFGASGRNGGWLTSAPAGLRRRQAAIHGRDAVVALQREMIATVDEVLGRLTAEGVDADAVKGGVLQVARNPAQLERLAAFVAEEQSWGDPDALLLDATQTRARIDIPDAVGGAFSPHTARIHPAKLVAGLARAVERHGVRIYEDTTALAIRPGAVRTANGDVRATIVLRCTEGFTRDLPGQRRTLLPMNSSMLVTSPLPEAVWDELGWQGREVLGDMAHAYLYAQRTADDRIALGGRGVPYRFGSRLDSDGSTAAATVRQLHRVLYRTFPQVRGARIDHVWSGVLGVPRDWCSQVCFDPVTGLGHAGGYVGHGVASANLAGRTLCDLALGRDSRLTHLPIVNWTGRRWELEPLRWLGVRAMYVAYRAADRQEARRRARTSWIAGAADRVSGRG